jgi:hypothetical protein
METVETGELLSTDATTSLFASTAVFTSVLRDKLCLGFTAVCVPKPHF